MVEVVVRGGIGRGMEEFSKEVKEILNNNDMNDGGVDTVASEPPVNYSAGRWESFLPKMKLRVLLVEADDSTRQIITALLRKCSYRVAAVADGLKAWEVLKGRPQNIDLILTEVDLPSISGFALLTLIMEHRICKNIPVIMMSSEDSVSTVYKCMLRGAADFLVKPVRKNELRNLWQHVWRRQASSSCGPGPPDESVVQQKVEATAENNAMSISSSDDVACIQRSREGIEKGTDAQSSSTKPELEDEGAEEGLQGLSHSKQIMPVSNKGILTNTEHKNMTKEVQHHHVVAEGSLVTTGMDASRNIQQDTKSNDHWRRFNSTNQACGDSHALMHSSKEAIDLIGAFDNYLKCINRSTSSNAGIDKFESLPLLDLSLRRSPPCGSVNQVTNERPRLNHSDSSAFTRYVNKTLQPGYSTSPIACNQPDNQEADSDKQFPDHTLNHCNSDPCGGRDISPPRPTPLSSEQLECRLLPAPIPVRGLRFQNISNAYGSLIPPAFYTPSSMSQLQSPTLVSHQEGSFQVSFNPLNHVIRDQQQPSCNPASQNVDDASDQNENKNNHQRFETTEEQGHLSSVIDQSPTSGFCNNTATHLQNLGHCSDGKLEPLSTAEYGNEEALRVHDGESIRSMQREAALMKFRLKRKERCFEKKVRYESRKKLAEKRPRVKGQFVRQVSNEPPAEKTS